MLLAAVVVVAVESRSARAAGRTSNRSLLPGWPFAGEPDRAGRAAVRRDPPDERDAGRPGAPATLIEFADLQCPFCAQYAVDTLPTILERFVRPGRLRLIRQADGLSNRYGVEGTPSFFIRRGGGQPEPLQVSSLEADSLVSELEAALGER